MLRPVFNTNVNVQSSRGKTKIEIEFKDEDELASIMNRVLSDMKPSEVEDEE